MQSLNIECLIKKTYNMRTDSTLGVIFFTRKKWNNPEILNKYKEEMELTGELLPVYSNQKTFKGGPWQYRWRSSKNT